VKERVRAQGRIAVSEARWVEVQFAGRSAAGVAWIRDENAVLEARRRAWTG